MIPKSGNRFSEKIMLQESHTLAVVDAIRLRFGRKARVFSLR
jgi:hypothetical protein